MAAAAPAAGAKGTEDRLVGVVACFAMNGDQSMIALSPNTEEIHIYATNKSEDVKKWEKKYTLREHGGYVSSIDWNATTNLIVSAGHDRNAYVWKYNKDTDEWKPTLVILRINRAATYVKWSPQGNKFAVASGAKCVPVCHFEASNDWWISKMIKKHKSTVLSLAWSSNNKFIVTGGCDMKCRVFSAFISGLDAEEDDGFGEVWKDQHKFGEVLAEFDQCKSWINSVAWSPSGFRLAFTGHNSTMSFVQILAGSPALVQTISMKNLPFVDAAFLSDNSLVAVGFDCNPTLFTAGGNDAEPAWTLQEQFDKEDKKGDAKAPAAAPSAGVASARAMFQNSATKGIAVSDSKSAPAKESAAKALPTVPTRHTNTITSLYCVRDAKGEVARVVTAGLDGRVLFWDLKKLGLQYK